MTHIIQATGVCFDGIGLLIVGESGVGKTSLALNLMDAGGTLVGDDAVRVTARANGVFMNPVDATRGMIEMRSVGIVTGVPVFENQKVDVVIALQKQEPLRLPDRRATYEVAGVSLPCFYLYGADFSLTSKVKMIIKVLKRQVGLQHPFR